MTASRSRIGWIGLGQMGRPIAMRLVRAGYDLSVWTRDPDGRDVLPPGTRSAASVAELAACSDILITMVGGPADVASLLVGPQRALTSMRPGTLIIDMTTSSPELAVRLAAAGDDAGVGVLDAPVSGGPAAAGAGTLSIMVGGSTDHLDRTKPILADLGSTVVHHGGPGAGQRAKLVNQILVATTMLGISEAFAFVERSSLDPERVLESLEAGIARSPLLAFVWQRLVSGDLTPGFAVGHMIKDLELALGDRPALDLPMSATEAVLARYRLVAERGYATAGTQALILAARGTGWSTSVDPRAERA